MKYNISYTTENTLCTGCGLCEDVCPNKCISFERVNGRYIPQIIQSKCLGEKCSRCLKVCPGIGTNLISLSKNFFTDSNVLEDVCIGRYVGLHTGYSLDMNIRLHSASGGIVTQFLVYFLEHNIIDGAVVTGFGKDKITPVSYLAKTKNEILDARSSKYCPVTLNRMGNEIINAKGTRFVVVGLPCHIQGFRKRAVIDKKIKEKIIGYFSIYCSSSCTFYAQDYLLERYGMKKNTFRILRFATMAA